MGPSELVFHRPPTPRAPRFGLVSCLHGSEYGAPPNSAKGAAQLRYKIVTNRPFRSHETGCILLPMQRPTWRAYPTGLRSAVRTPLAQRLLWRRTLNGMGSGQPPSPIRALPTLQPGPSCRGEFAAALLSEPTGLRALAVQDGLRPRHSRRQRSGLDLLSGRRRLPRTGNGWATLRRER